MNYEELKLEFKRIGITETGVVSASDAHRAIIDGQAVMSSSKKIKHIDEIMPGAQSVIVFLVPYNHGIEPVNISIYATGRDYHKVCNKISKIIISKLAESGFNSVSFADTGPLNERKLGVMSGLGTIGKNGFLINEKYGSYTFIGYILTDCKILPTTPMQDTCALCGKCMESCPGKALSDKGVINNRCVSYLTQKKGELTPEEIDIIKSGKSAWGCDICQNVCPMNKNVQLTELEDFNKNLILCIENEYLSNKEFKEKYSDRAFSWRGKSVIYRNLSIFNEK